MREVSLEEWKAQRKMPKRLSEEFEEWARTAVRRRPTTPEQLTNSIRYIMLKKNGSSKKGFSTPLDRGNGS
jgi:hypothetical protein